MDEAKKYSHLFLLEVPVLFVLPAQLLPLGVWRRLLKRQNDHLLEANFMTTLNDTL